MTSAPPRSTRSPAGGSSAAHGRDEPVLDQDPALAVLDPRVVHGRDPGVGEQHQSARRLTSSNRSTSTSPRSVIFSAGITDSARKASDWNGDGSVQPRRCAASTQFLLAVDDLVEGRVGEQPGHGQGQLRADAAVLDDDHAAADLAQPRDRSGHVVVVHADDDDVVRVVRDRLRERPGLQPGAADEPDAHAAGAEMPLEHGDLRQVALGVGDDLAVDDGRLLDERLGDDLVGDDPDHAGAAALPRDAEAVRADRSDADGVADPVRHLVARRGLDVPAGLEHELRLEPLQVGDDEHVGLVAGRERPEIAEPVPGRAVQRGHDERILGRDAARDRLAHHAVDVALGHDVLGLAVVGAEREAVRPELGDQREQVVEVARAGRLANQHPHADAQALPALLDGPRLVVGADAGGGVRVQRLAEHARRVAVDVRRALERQLLELMLVAADDAGEVHHLGEPEHPASAQEPLQVAERERPARRLELRGRHRGRRHEEDVERDVLRHVGDPVDAVGAEHVRELVRVRDHCRRPERDDQPRELVHEQLR